MEANQRFNLNIEEFIPQWSIKKHQEIKKQLQGYWSEDIWLSSENPFNFQDRTKRKTQKGYTGSRLCFENCPSIIKEEIKYACYQKVKKQEFFEICFREKWINITGNQIIYNDDLPKYKRNYNPRYIPEEVIKQIIEYLPNIGNFVYGRMFLILIECGMRIGELCKISFDCLQQDTKGDYFLKYYQSKFKKYNTIPISLDTVKIIQEQQSHLKQNNCSDSPFLFPSPKFKAQYKAIGASAFCDALKKLIYEYDIRDLNGKLWNFTSHQCRHTVGTRMINNDVPQHIVQRFLGHESPTMTQVYAHVHDKTLKKEIAKYHDTRVVNVAGEVVESKSPELDNDLDLHLLKKKVLAQSLPNGSCARPIV